MVLASGTLVQWASAFLPFTTSTRPLLQNKCGARLSMSALGGQDSEFDAQLRDGNTKKCLDILRRAGTSLEIDNNRATTLITQVGEAALLAVDPEGPGPEKGQLGEDELSFVYSELHRRGILTGYGSVTMDVVPYRNKQDMSPAKLAELTGMDMQALAPGRSDNTWAYAGAALCLAEVAAAQYFNIDPLQVALPATIGVFALDRIVLKGALFESIARIINPTYKAKIIRHEAGHFLLAYLLGLGISGCLLDPWQVRKFVRGQGGTVFADPTFARGLQSGSITKTSIDRFSIVLMAGIAAEAVVYGRAEGGASDEAGLISILSSIQPPFTYEMIRQQARWAAVQAALLLKEHQAAYDVLVAALEKGSSVGECIMAIEGSLRKMPSPTPVEVRRH
ncbi:hypothetical protein JKP88DRAFT_336324 [Tribonema minus]|uniref:ATP-dependent Zn protease n=1 Tax=Tribonema minus TaxID=303371 RepID=A0A835YLP7_9STRA|nr:hypothetical protein JKP88DRAFT_336324 [Tribonema minus]